MIIQKIISGGQTGADQGGLLAGKVLGLETGGWAPKGWKVDREPHYPNGINPKLAELGLQEHPSSQYPARTMANADMADVTIAFMLNGIPSVGTSKTIGYCQTGRWVGHRSAVILDETTWQTAHRPYLVIDNVRPDYFSRNIILIQAFIELALRRKNSITINIAGHRQSSLTKLRHSYDFEIVVRDTLVQALQ